MANFKSLFKYGVLGIIAMQCSMLFAYDLQNPREIRVLKPLVHSQQALAVVPIITENSKIVAIQTLKPVIPNGWDGSVKGSRSIASEKAEPVSASKTLSVIKTLKPHFNIVDKPADRAIASDLKEPILIPLPEKYRILPQRIPSHNSYKTVNAARPVIPSLKKAPQNTIVPMIPVLPVPTTTMRTPAHVQPERLNHPKSLDELITVPSGLNDPIYDAPVQEDVPEVQGN